jgi:hypothetical protein
VETLEGRCLPSTVTNLLDAGPGSLRDAIATTPAGGTVDFQPGLTGTITLTSGELAINEDLTITGPGADVITVSGNNASRVFDIAATFSVSISGLTVSNGQETHFGGGIENQGTLSVTGCTITGNAAANVNYLDYSRGGGIDNSGTLTVTDCTISGNNAHAGLRSNAFGGGIYNAGTLTVTGSTITGNGAGAAGYPTFGGGIDNMGTTITITDCTISSNGADFGGGIENYNGTATVTRCTVSLNHPDGIDSGGTLTVTDCTISGNGFGIANRGGTLTVTDCTVSGNAGDGIDNVEGTYSATSTVTDSTISGNSGCGIYNGAYESSLTLTVTGCTITGNLGTGHLEGGVVIDGPLVVANLRNTIVAGNTADGFPDVNGAINSQGHNLIGDGTGGSGYDATDLVGTSSNPIDPKLGPLADNGGPTQTMALLPGSPAINSGDNTDAPAFDQRGPGYARIVNGIIDIGAFQFQGYRTFVVTNTKDAGPGSLRQAILDANAQPDTSTIDFNIPGAGVQRIRPTTPLPDVTQSVLIYGYSQPGYSGVPLIEINGSRAGWFADGLTLSGPNCAVSGLVIDGFGGAAIRLEGAGGDVITRDYLGTDPTGSRALGNGVGVFIDGSSQNTIGGLAAIFGNLISGNRQAGIGVRGSGNLIQANRIGTDVSGTAALPNGTGVSIFGNGSNNTIGGDTLGVNLISGNQGDGIGVYSGTANLVLGNLIGTDASGTTALPNRYGVGLFSGSASSVIGGTNAGAGNVISGNRRDGVRIESNGNLVQGNFIGTDRSGTLSLGNGRDGVMVDRKTGNAIRQNGIFANGHLGIELRHGGNQGQPAPVLTSANIYGFSMSIAGSLTAAANTTFTVEVFISPNSGPGQGARFGISFTVTTDSSGRAEFTFQGASPPDVESGQFLTATATDPAGNTSSFSTSVVVTGSSPRTIDVPGANETFVYGINDAGQIVGAYLDSTLEHGFLLSGGNYSALDVPGAFWTDAQGINDSGDIVGTYATYSSGPAHGFLLSGGSYTTIDVPGAMVTRAEGINDSGQIVG